MLCQLGVMKKATQTFQEERKKARRNEVRNWITKDVNVAQNMENIDMEKDTGNCRLYSQVQQ